MTFIQINIGNKETSERKLAVFALLTKRSQYSITCREKDKMNWDDLPALDFNCKNRKPGHMGKQKAQSLRKQKNI